MLLCPLIPLSLLIFLGGGALFFGWDWIPPRSTRLYELIGTDAPPFVREGTNLEVPLIPLILTPPLLPSDFANCIDCPGGASSAPPPLRGQPSPRCGGDRPVGFRRRSGVFVFYSRHER